MYKKILITTLLIILLISSCSSPKITYTPPPIEGDWSVRMIQTGGIAGVNRAVEVLSNGRYTVYQQAGGKGIKKQLSETDLAKLEELITNLEIANVQTDSICADCFEYDIEIQSGGRKMVFQLNDMSLPDSGAGELVTFLQSLFQ
ncbi:MAG: hypothetical protein ACK40V_04520 [Anaerolineales bacterium]